MDINDFLRTFFGFHRMPTDRFDHPFHETDEDFEGPQDSNNSPEDDFANMFHNMESMFNGKFSIQPGFLDFPNLEMAPAQESPRDLMLKSPDTKQCENCTQPTVISIQNQEPESDFVRKEEHGFGRLETEDHGVFAPKPFFFTKSFSSQIIQSGNGVVEEQHTSTDNRGRTVTTVRKSLGDQTYQVVTESDKTGVIEKKEDFINIDEKAIPGFEDKLKQQKSRVFGFLSEDPNQDLLQAPKFPFRGPYIQPVRPEHEDILPLAPPGDPMYQSIFKKLFGL